MKTPLWPLTRAEEEFRCKFCFKAFASSHSCRLHERKSHDYVYPKYKCSDCDFKCSIRDALAEHTALNHIPDAILPLKFPPKHFCPICGKQFCSRKNRKRHQRTVHGCPDKYLKHKCGECEFSSANKKVLLRHVAADHPEAPRPPPEYPCPSCEKIFSKLSALVNHKKMHVASRTRSRCSVCTKSFSSVKNCRSHERIFHGKVKKAFPCAECSVAFSLKSYLCQHVEDAHPHLMKANENLVFATWDDFAKWKTETEERTSTYFKTSHCSAFPKVYACNRSGYYQSRSKGIRRPKATRTLKINSYCPATITVKLCQKSEVLYVNYFPTHLGHSTQAEHTSLCKNENSKYRTPEENAISNSPEVLQNASVDVEENQSNLVENSHCGMLEDLRSSAKSRCGTLEDLKSSAKSHCGTLENLRSSAKSLLMDLASKIDDYSEEQCKEVIGEITKCKLKCQVIKSAENSNKKNHFSRVDSTTSCFKRKGCYPSTIGIVESSKKSVNIVYLSCKSEVKSRT